MTHPSDWSSLFTVEPGGPHDEDLDAGGEWLAELVAAVDFLRRGDRFGLTVWDALEEAIRWWASERASAIVGVADPEQADLRWNDPDPLRRSLTALLTASELDPATPVDIALQQAVRRWVATMAERHNDSCPWA